MVGALLSVSSMAGCARPSPVYRPAIHGVVAGNGDSSELRPMIGERYIIRSAGVQNDTLSATLPQNAVTTDARLTVAVDQAVSLPQTERRLNAGGDGVLGLSAGELVGLAIVLVVVIMGLSSR
jgi:hypothetical protein